LQRIKDTNVFGCGQPTLQGFKNLFELALDDGFDRFAWVCLRAAPIVVRISCFSIVFLLCFECFCVCCLFSTLT
jgi:hypothetical protein